MSLAEITRINRFDRGLGRLRELRQDVALAAARALVLLEIVSADVAATVQDTLNSHDSANDAEKKDVSPVRAHTQAWRQILTRGISTRHSHYLLGLVNQLIDKAFCSARIVLGDVVADFLQIRHGKRRELTVHWAACLCRPTGDSEFSIGRRPR